MERIEQLTVPRGLLCSLSQRRLCKCLVCDAGGILTTYVVVPKKDNDLGKPRGRIRRECGPEETLAAGKK